MESVSASCEASAPLEIMGARVVAHWLGLAVHLAERTRALVDSLNVFPVPDSDTGTNVLLTLRAASDALRLLPAGADVAQTARAAADGALRGARGNSGLLISQALAALADVSAETPHPAGLRPVELVTAYERMATTTWAAVSHPVTGTLLTVAQDAAAAARDALAESSADCPATLSAVAASAAFGAQESVVETGGLGHGPVDAGGAALMLLLTALSDTVDAGVAGATPYLASRGAVRSPYSDVACQMLNDLAAGGLHQASGPEVDGVSTGEFEVMYLLEATSAQAASLRRHLEEADLLVACEPDLSFPALAESCLDAITAAAAPWAVPVVALAARSTLSAHERAQWGLHGVFATDGALGPGAAGARIARTWLPAADGPDSAAGRKRVG